MNSFDHRTNISSTIMSNFIKRMFVSDNGSERMTVPEFYKGKSIFVTGFSGLLGKLVAEKLLWSCPDIDKIYVLIRAKKGKTPQERLKKITDLLAFDRVRDKFPGAIENKLYPVSGDISIDGLGLSEDDRRRICNDVSIVIHSAASVRFDDTLERAVDMNMKGTKRLLDLSLDMTKLECFIHVSTAYSNSDYLLIGEELYPAKTDWRNMINIADKIDPRTLQILSQKFMDNIPNTYIFTKGLTEHIVNDYRDRLPVLIIRPSLVVPAYKEPIPGWIDNVFGPLGINIGFFTGIARCGLGDDQCFVNCVHTDFVVNSIILAPYHKVLIIEDKLHIPIYNACSPPSYKHTHEDYMLLHKYEPTEKYLDSEGINYFSCKFFKNELCYTVNFLFRHMISAIIIDLLLIIMQKPPMLAKIRRNIYIANKRLKFIATESNSFKVDKFLSLPSVLNGSDIDEFHYDFTKCNMKEVYYNAIVLSKNVLLKPMYKYIDVTRKVLKWLYILDKGSVVLTYLLSLWFFYVFNIPLLIFNTFTDIFLTL